MTGYVGCDYSFYVQLFEADEITPINISTWAVEATIARKDKPCIKQALTVGAGITFDNPTIGEISISLTDGQTTALSEGWLTPKPFRLEGALYRTDGDRVAIFQFADDFFKLPGAQ